MGFSVFLWVSGLDGNQRSGVRASYLFAGNLWSGSLACRALGSPSVQWGVIRPHFLISGKLPRGEHMKGECGEDAGWVLLSDMSPSPQTVSSMKTRT